MRPPDLTGNGGSTATVEAAANSNGKQSNVTGRHTVVFRKGATQEGINLLRSEGFKVFVSNSSDPNVVREDEVGDATAIVHATLGVATIEGGAEQISRLTNAASDSGNPILAIKPEKVRRMLLQTKPMQTRPPVSGAAEMFSLDYLKGSRDAYDKLIETFFAKLETNRGSAIAETAGETLGGFDESQLTWGLQATNAVDSPFSGRGVKVAVLDTGMDFDVDANGTVQFHSDFAGRKITTASFVRGVTSAKDDHGHGTHCIGTSCGPRRPGILPGYGIAFNAEIYAGKVLDSEGRGADEWIIHGIEWAINQGCRIVSMSLGAAKQPGDIFNILYEEIAQRALDAGTVIIAAAGNDSVRPSFVAPVSGPADCPSIVAVAAIDPNLAIAEFSNGGINTSGGEVNIAAPGVNVLSSFRRPPDHKRLQGTSMATPHVAGIAALFAEANPSATGTELRDLVINAARSLPLGTRDVGQGLAQAPLATSIELIPGRLTKRGGVGIEQTSPITVGGGGSVGVAFDLGHYIPQAGSPGQPTKFVNQMAERIEKLRIIDKYGAAPDRTPSTTDCRIVVHCQDFDSMGQVIPNSDSPLTIYGNPLSIELKVQDFSYGKPPGGNNNIYYSLSRKITGDIDVYEGPGATPTIKYPAPTGGICTVDVLNR
ncbi:MAG: hypothetical protein QOF62_2417 [Pyrinomonadaceae bacterium]|jgi:subtilisin family serine protease|nr:hypothetical protein [Pyrinomonadaceae bacterium]